MKELPSGAFEYPASRWVPDFSGRDLHRPAVVQWSYPMLPGMRLLENPLQLTTPVPSQAAFRLGSVTWATDLTRKRLRTENVLEGRLTRIVSPGSRRSETIQTERALFRSRIACPTRQKRRSSE
jgi:hypothetical protein